METNNLAVSYLEAPMVHNNDNRIGPEMAAALAELQGELENAKKDSSGYGYNYSNLETVIATAKPLLAKHGFSVIQPLTSASEGNVAVSTLLLHKSGQYIRSTAELPIIDMKGCNAAQGAGASLSYLRRYAYQSILGMASEDNDASSEGFKKSSAKKTSDPKNSLRKKKTEENKTETKTEESSGSSRRRRRS